jgi:hypothetical protein
MTASASPKKQRNSITSVSPVKVASSAVLARSYALAAGVSGVSMAAPPSRVATNPAPCPSAADARNRRPS